MNDKDESEGVVSRAFGDLALEFSEHAKGSGAALGRSARFLAGAVEVVVTSPLLIPKGYQRIVDVIKPLIDERIKQIPVDKLRDPPLMIAGPAIEAMRFTIDERALCEMFANLLAASMNSDSQGATHPSFVEVIKQLVPVEAKILRFLRDHGGSWPVVNLRSKEKDGIGYLEIVRNITDIGDKVGCNSRGAVQVYLDNLCRLNLCDMPEGISLANDTLYERLKTHPSLEPFIDKIKTSDRAPTFENKLITLTTFGRTFVNICLPEQGSAEAD